MKVDVKRISAIAAVLSIALLPTGSAAAQSVTPAQIYIQNNVVNGQMFQRELNTLTTTSSSWQSIAMVNGYTPISEVSMSKFGTSTNNTGYKFLIQAVVVKQDSTGKHFVSRRVFSTLTNTWTQWRVELSQEVAPNSKVSLFTNNYQNLNSTMISAIVDPNGNLLVQSARENNSRLVRGVTLEPVLWSTYSVAARNVGGEVSIFMGHKSTTPASSRPSTIFVSYINTNREVETVYSENTVIWTKFYDPYELYSDDYAKSVKTIFLENTFVENGITKAIGAMPLQVRKGDDNYLYYRVLNCFNPSDTCLFTQWVSTGDRTSGDFSITGINSLHGQFVVSLRGIDNNGYTSVYKANLIPWSNFQLQLQSGNVSQNIASDLYTASFAGSNTGDSLIQTAIMNGKTYQRLLKISMNGVVLFDSASWVEVGNFNSLKLNGTYITNNM